MTTTLMKPGRRSLISGPHRPSSPWLALAVLGTAQLMLVLDATVVNIALPRAQAALGFSDADRQWVISAYSLAFGSLLLIGGRLADAFGQRRMFLIGLVGFAAASVLGGLAGNFGVLVSARALQGGFGALLAPAALSMLIGLFTEPVPRARAFGCFGAISAAGGSVGLMLGGTLTEYVSWRWVMFVNVVVAAAGLLGAIALPPDRAIDRRRAGSDVLGAALAMTGVLTIVYGLSRAATGAGFSAVLDPLTLACVAAGLALLVGFTVAERRARNPLVPLRIVLDRKRGGAYAAMFLSAIGTFGILLFLTYYLESTLGYSPVRAGLAFLPMAATMVAVGGVGNAVLIGRIGPQKMVPSGLLIAGIGMAMLTRIGVDSGYLSTVLPATLVTAVGLALVFAPCFNLGTSGVAQSDAGIASATVHVAQQIGGSIGTAVLNAVATTVAARYVMARSDERHAAAVHAHAAVHSYVVVFWVCAVAFCAAAVVVGALLNPSLRAASRSVMAPSASPAPQT